LTAEKFFSTSKQAAGVQVRPFILIDYALKSVLSSWPRFWDFLQRNESLIGFFCLVALPHFFHFQSVISHVNNLITGVTKGFQVSRYCRSHFFCVAIVLVASLIADLLHSLAFSFAPTRPP
jgi:hypothetical protein